MTYSNNHLNDVDYMLKGIILQNNELLHPCCLHAINVSAYYTILH